MRDELARHKRVATWLMRDHERTPRNAETSIALAEALLRLAQRTPDAPERIRVLERALKADPYDARIHRALGVLRHRNGNLAGALAGLRAAVALDPTDLAAALDLALVSLVRLRQRPDKELADRAIAGFASVLEAKSCTPVVARIANAGRLIAAVHAPVAGPSYNRLAKLLPAALIAIAPDPEWLRLISYLGTAMAFTAYFRKAQQRPAKQDELAARGKLLAALSTGLAPWFARFPEDRRLTSIAAAIAILRCADGELAQTVAARGEELADPRLLHLFVRERLMETDHEKRVEILRAIDGIKPLSAGLDRELIGALHQWARAAICRSDGNAAAARWKGALQRDPYNPALHHNLAMVALAQRDATELTGHLRATLDLILSYWWLRGGRADGLRQLAAKHESFAARLRESIEASLTAESGQAAPAVVGAWCGEMLAGIVIRGVALSLDRKPLSPDSLQELLHYLQALPPMLDTGIPAPASFAMLVDPAIVGQPLLHYDALGVTSDVAPSAIQRRYAEVIDELNQVRLRALMAGDAAAMQRIARKIAQVEAAFVVLSDVAKRKKYDGECISADEHAYHLARRRLIDEIFEFAHRLHKRGQLDTVPILLRAYEALPHERMDVYFEAVQPGERMIIRTSLLLLRYKPMLDRAQVLIRDKEWEKAHELLVMIMGSGGSELRYAHYLAAGCQLHLERAHIEKHGAQSGRASRIEKRAARTRLAAMPKLPGRDDDDEDEA